MELYQCAVVAQSHICSFLKNEIPSTTMSERIERKTTNSSSFVIWVISTIFFWALAVCSLADWARVSTPPRIMFKIWWQQQGLRIIRIEMSQEMISLKLRKLVTNDTKTRSYSFFKASCHEIFKSYKLLFRCRGLTSVFVDSRYVQEFFSKKSFKNRSSSWKIISM